jgi:hypothetical protein
VGVQRWKPVGPTKAHVVIEKHVGLAGQILLFTTLKSFIRRRFLVEVEMLDVSESI